jgi:glycosyltransferase involved in cell wall biosynthesis
MTAPLVSIIIPAYNARRFVRTAVESTLAQTHQRVEVIVVDDGSTDDTAAVLASIRNRILWVSRANGGPAAARNTGLTLATGEYVTFLDADDRILPDKLRRQLHCLAGTPSAGWVYCDVLYVDEGGRHLYRASERFAYAKRARLEGHLFPELFSGNFIPVHAPLFRRQCLREVEPLDENRRLIGQEDWDLLLRLSVRAEAAYVPEVLAECLVHSGSLSANPTARDRGRFHTLDKAARIFPDQIRALGSQGRRIVADTHNWFGYHSYREGRWTDAVGRLRASLRVWPWQGRAWFLLIRSLLARAG